MGTSHAACSVLGLFLSVRRLAEVPCGFSGKSSDLLKLLGPLGEIEHRTAQTFLFWEICPHD